MTSEIWVWSWLPGDTAPTLAGRFHHAKLPGAGQPVYRGSFVYGRSYLENPDALALDPVQLQLLDRQYETVALGGFFGPLRDAMPDDWGRYVIDRLHGPQQQNPVAYLLLGQGDQTGNLGFSTARDAAPAYRALPAFDILGPARSVFRDLESGRAIDSRTRALVHPNTNLGGARPKFTIEHAGRQWMAKFPAASDRGAPIGRIECAMLKLAGACGIHAANAFVVEDDILLVERFDRALSRDGNGWRRDAFLSAQTVFYANAEVQAYAFSGSYARLSREMAKFCEDLAENREQLYRRMLFNCCISNTDDHERNHGFLAGDMPGTYTLSPAYDMVPRRHGTQRREHALAIGEQGFVASRENALSDCGAFGLDRARAVQLLDEIEATVQAGWKAALMEQGLGDDEAEAWRSCFLPLPETVA